MATKQEKAVKSAVKREKKKGIVREEKHVLWFLVAIILLLLYLLLAQHNGWWPYSRPKLGTAFYTNVAASTPGKSASSDSSNTAGGSDAGNDNGGSAANPNGNGGSNGGSGGNNNGGSPTTPPAGSDSIADLAASINVGDTKTQVNGRVHDLGEGCAVIADVKAQIVGKQEVCTYSQGNKIVTVTYLNNRVISASKSGF